MEEEAKAVQVGNMLFGGRLLVRWAFAVVRGSEWGVRTCWVLQG